MHTHNKLIISNMYNDATKYLTLIYYTNIKKRRTDYLNIRRIKCQCFKNTVKMYVK